MKLWLWLLDAGSIPATSTKAADEENTNAEKHTGLETAALMGVTRFRQRLRRQKGHLGVLWPAVIGHKT